MTEVPASHQRPDPLRERVREDSVALFMAHWRVSLVAISLVTVAAALGGHELVSERTRMLWVAVILGNYALQGLVMLQLERAPTLREGIARWMPWLLLSIFVSGLGWGFVPWLLQGAPVSVLVFASLFNAMLIFCVVNAPATPPMQACAVLPVAAVNTVALLHHPTLPYAMPVAAAFVALCGVILLFGVRVQGALRASMRERHVARDLAHELGLQQQRLVEVERERTLLLERHRLMQDMHDGLGSSLVSALAHAERGQLQQEDLLRTLHECLDDLRVVIDSLEPMDHDLVALLATLRFRTGRRLEQAGIQLQWDMSDLPPLRWLGPPEALQVMRIVQEALSNIIQHARAQRVCITAAALEGEVEVRIVDDGVGFDAAEPAVVSTVATTAASAAGRGLRSMQQRAQRLGGRVHIASTPGEGTCLSLRLPVTAETPSA
jgi:signal transduction histidine kinase